MKFYAKFFLFCWMIISLIAEESLFAQEVQSYREFVTYTSVIKGMSWITETDPANTHIHQPVRKCDLKLDQDKYQECLSQVATKDFESKTNKIKQEVKSICNLKNKSQKCRLERIENDCELHNGSWPFVACKGLVTYSFFPLSPEKNNGVKDGPRRPKDDNTRANESRAISRGQSKVSEK